MKSPPSALLNLFISPQIISEYVIAGYYNNQKQYGIISENEQTSANYIKTFSELISQDIFVIAKLLKVSKYYIITVPTNLISLSLICSDSVITNTQIHQISIQLLNMVNQLHCKKFIHGNINLDNLFFINNKLRFGICGPWSENFFEKENESTSQTNDCQQVGIVINKLIADKQVFGNSGLSIAAEMLLQGERCGKVLDFLEKKGTQNVQTCNQLFNHEDNNIKIKQNFNERIKALNSKELELGMDIDFGNIINLEQDEYSLKLLKLKNQSKEIEIDHKMILDGVNNKYQHILDQYQRIEALLNQKPHTPIPKKSNNIKNIIPKTQKRDSLDSSLITSQILVCCIKISKISANFTTQKEVDFAFSQQRRNQMWSGKTGKQYLQLNNNHNSKQQDLQQTIDVYGSQGEGEVENVGILVMCASYEKVREFFTFQIKFGGGSSKFWILSNCGKVSLKVCIEEVQM